MYWSAYTTRPQEIQDDYAERYATEDGFDKYTAADEWLAEFAEGFDFENNDDRNLLPTYCRPCPDALGLTRPTAEEIARELLLDSESRLRGREITPSDRLRIQGIKYTKESKDQESDGVNFRKVDNGALYSGRESTEGVGQLHSWVKITIHPTTEAFMAGAKGYRNIRPTDGGATLYDANGNATEVIINAERANERTIAHETAHPILSKALSGRTQHWPQKVRDDVMKALSESTNKELKRFAYAYNPSARADEFPC